MVHANGRPELLPINNAARWEDGTINFSSLSAVTLGIRHLQRLGMANINARVGCLTSWLLSQAPLLRHSNGETPTHFFKDSKPTHATA